MRARVGSVLVECAMVLALTACVGPQSRIPAGTGTSTADRLDAAAERQRDIEAFWSALQNLELKSARRQAPDDEHRRLLEGLRLMIDGQMPKAASSLRRSYRSARDSLVRLVSRAGLANALAYQEDWRALFALSHDSLRLGWSPKRDQAGVLVWSEVMRLAPRAHYTEPAEPIYLPMRRSVTGVPVVAVRVNGCTRHFWLDTGSSTSLIASDVATRCGVVPLVADTLELVTSTGRLPARPAVVPSFQIGALPVSNLRAAIVDAGLLRMKNITEAELAGAIRIDGVVGFDLLRRYDVEIDYAGEQVTLRRPGSSRATRGRDRNLFWLGYPVARLSDPDGNALYFGIDTGAGDSFATLKLLTKLPKRFRPKARYDIAGFGGDTSATVPVLDDVRLTVVKTTLRLSQLIVRDHRRLLFLDLDGVLGSDVGAAGTIRFDMTRGIFSVGETR